MTEATEIIEGEPAGADVAPEPEAAPVTRRLPAFYTRPRERNKDMRHWRAYLRTSMPGVARSRLAEMMIAGLIPGIGDAMERRFWPHVLIVGDCWLWTGNTTNNGYGQWCFTSWAGVYVHRAAYTARRGLIPEALTLDHRVGDQRSCCNPAHLQPMTIGENVRLAQTQTHCDRGHEFNEANTYIASTGSRSCRPCTNLRARLQRAARAGASA